MSFFKQSGVFWGAVLRVHLRGWGYIFSIAFFCHIKKCNCTAVDFFLWQNVKTPLARICCPSFISQIEFCPKSHFSKSIFPKFPFSGLFGQKIFGNCILPEFFCLWILILPDFREKNSILKTKMEQNSIRRKKNLSKNISLKRIRKNG